MKKRNKISIIGAGFVGSTAAHWAATKELGDMVLIDVNEGAAKAKALDLAQAAPIESFDSHIQGGSDYALTKDSDVVLITAGIPRKAGMGREELLSTNASIVGDCAKKVAAQSPHAVLIVVSNPLDVMCHVAWKESGFPKERVFGMAGVLDSARFRYFIAEELNVSVQDVHAFVYGGHGDTMLPLPRYVNVGGIPLEQLLSADRIAALVERTAKGGAEIVNLLKTGSAYYAPSASVIDMLESILKDKKRVLPCSCMLSGEYGVEGVYVGVLAKIGAQGVERIMPLELNEEEKKNFSHSVNSVRELLSSLEKIKG